MLTPISATLVLLCYAGFIRGQQAIFLANPSFEDNARYSALPGGWQNCAFNNESPPDIHPVENGSFRVIQKPAHGETYLGMVVRDTRTVESVGQELPEPLLPDHCYELKIQLCKSEHLFSRYRKTNAEIDFNKPAVLRIWGGISPCGQKILLAQSPVIQHTDWQTYTFHFRAPDSLSWMAFEAWYDPAAEAPYNGNLLLDQVSPILPLDCETLAPLIDPDTLTVPAYIFQKVKITGYRTHYVHTGYGGFAYMGLREVASPEDLRDLILLDCPGIGFVEGKKDLLGGEFSLLKEVAVNVPQFPGIRLIAGIHDAGAKLTKKRKKKIRAAFREVGLKKEYYRIVVDNTADKAGEWYCNKGLWLQLEQN